MGGLPPITLQWLGGSDLELGVFIFPYIPYIPIQWGAKELRIEFPNHQLDKPWFIGFRNHPQYVKPMGSFQVAHW